MVVRKTGTGADTKRAPAGPKRKPPVRHAQTRKLTNRQGTSWLSSLFDMKEVEVQPNQTLWNIAQEHCGDGQRWRELYLLNILGITGNQVMRGETPSPDLIYPGQKVRVLPF